MQWHGDWHKDDAPDWMPAASAIGLPDGERRHGSTGQLWEARGGKWVRIYNEMAPQGSNSHKV